MAMIQCPECGQEISDKAKKCIHCGKVLVKEVLTKKFCNECGKEIATDAVECPYCGCPIEDDREECTLKSENSKRKTIKRFIFPITGIVVLAIIVFLIINFVGSNLNEDEQLAYQNAVEMRSMMRDPDSFKLYDEMFLLKHHDEGVVDYIYTIFEYGGTNGYGAIVTNEAIFKDGEYIMDYADEPDEDDQDYIRQLMVKADLTFFMIADEEDVWEMVDIDIEKIKKKMGLE